MVVGYLSLRHFTSCTGYQYEVELLSIAVSMQVATVPERWRTSKIYLVKWGSDVIRLDYLCYPGLL